MTPDQDSSCRILAELLRKQSPFYFARFGDGFMECVSGKVGHTCDGEVYSVELGTALLSAWNDLIHGRNVYLGDWRTASFNALTEHQRYFEQYAELLAGSAPAFLHWESLLLMRESDALAEFYRTVAQDRRRKAYMGPLEMSGAVRALGCSRHIVTPMSNLFAAIDRITAEVYRDPFDVLLYGAGMAGTIAAVRCWERFPDRTYIHLGSAMDVLFRQQSRQQQISPDRARYLLREILL